MLRLSLLSGHDKNRVANARTLCHVHKKEIVIVCILGLLILEILVFETLISTMIDTDSIPKKGNTE